MKWLFVLGTGVLAGLQILATVEARAGEPISVCVAADGALRLLAKGGACKPGEQKKLFAEWEPEKPEPPDEKDQELAALRRQVDTLSKRLPLLEQKAQDSDQSLSQRLTALEQRKPPEKPQKNTANRVTAPFEVVGRGGTVILRVAEKVSSTEGRGANVTIGAGDAGNYALRVFRNGGKLVAGVGQSQSGTGLVAAMDGDTNGVIINANDRSIELHSGNKRTIALLGNESAVAIFGPSGKAVTVMRQSQQGGGGTFEATDGGGTWVFRGGFDGTDGNACAKRPGQTSRCLNNLPLTHN